jgi:hypothetical protein
LQELIANALGAFVRQARQNFIPLLFATDRVCHVLTRLLRVYSQAIKALEADAEMKGLLRQRKLDLAQWNMLQGRIVEEFRQRGRLHPVFAWDQPPAVEQAVENVIDIRAPQKRSVLAPQLTASQFQSPERLVKCEKLYLRYISNKLVRKLLNESDANCATVRHFIREILANTVLLPLTYLFTPAMVTWWAETALTAIGENIEAEPSEETSEMAEESKNTAEMRHFDRIMSVGKAPHGFPNDPGWDFMAGSIDAEEAKVLLEPEPEGSFFISKPLQETQPDIFVVWVRWSPEIAGLDDASYSTIKGFKIRCTSESYSVIEKVINCDAQMSSYDGFIVSRRRSSTL